VYTVSGPSLILIVLSITLTSDSDNVGIVCVHVNAFVFNKLDSPTSSGQI
jgi:hypothetical protein